MTAPAKTETGRIPGEVGIWVFVLGDMTVFALFFATYTYSQARDGSPFTQAQKQLNLSLGLLNTVLLLTSSLLVAIAVSRVLQNDSLRVRQLFGGALACGLCFLVVKAFEWGHLFSEGRSAGGTGPEGELFNYYFMFTGIHALHVVIGCVLLSRMVALNPAQPRTAKQKVLVESVGVFWHMVDLLWVVLFALFYLTR